MGARKKIEGKMRGVVGANVLALARHHYPESKNLPRAVSERLRVSLSQSQRILKGAHGFTLETLETVAESFGLDAWQLLVPEFDPLAPPQLAGERSTSRRISKTTAAN